MSDPECDLVHCKFIEARGKAYLLENEDGQQEFFPMSQVSFERCSADGTDAVAEIPIWLLEKKGWR